MRLKNYLIERTFNIDVDVDWVYDKFFKKYIDLFQSGRINEFIKKASAKSNPWGYTFGTCQSTDLPSVYAQHASSINNVMIVSGILKEGSSYRPSPNNMIFLSLHYGAFNGLISNGSLDSILGHFDDKTARRFLGEFNKTSVKGTIYHELSHWIDDTLHHSHIKNLLDVARESGNNKLLLKHGTALFTNHEINAQVHAIKQVKRDYDGDWDSITWDEIVNMKPSFHVVSTALNVTIPVAREEYFKALLKRLNREKLLGKNMRDINDLLKIGR